jgi:hypothetical protein
MINTIEDARGLLDLSTTILFKTASTLFDITAIRMRGQPAEALNKDQTYQAALAITQGGTYGLVAQHLLTALHECDMVSDLDMSLAARDTYAYDDAFRDNSIDLSAYAAGAMRKSVFAKHNLDSVLIDNQHRLPVLHSMIKNPENPYETLFPPARMKDLKAIGKLLEQTYDTYDDNAMYFLEHDVVFKTLNQFYHGLRHGANINQASPVTLSHGIEAVEDFFMHNAFEEASRFIPIGQDVFSQTIARRAINLYKEPNILVPQSLINRKMNLN